MSSGFRCPKRLILIRHGESEGNVDHHIYSSTADGLLHLTEQGWRQAMSAGEALKELIGDEPVHWMVSPYVRTRETLNALAMSWGGLENIKWSEDVRLREQDFGNFQVPEKMQEYKEERLRFGPFFYRMPDGESPADVYDRLSSFFESMYRGWERKPPELMQNLNQVIVCHGLTISVFLMRMFKYSVDDFNRYVNFTNAEFCVLTRRNQKQGKYSMKTTEDFYCVKQRQCADGTWKAGQPEARSVRTGEDACRFDRTIHTKPPSMRTAPSLVRERSLSTDDVCLEKVFKRDEGTGFRCDTSNLVETVLVGSQADDLGVMRGWYVTEVNGAMVKDDEIKQHLHKAKSAGVDYTVKFRVPSYLATPKSGSGGYTP
eukprot:TRINITY_DN51220_c0_g1_i1.p1 TRINITY_DN51220_c0_g1~~TRINITY_DN51220_c0_g1_i1.p1  ORF type:complete len:383 (-),score=60.55 TRINITY_DN51220_c0_g1_i1:104-1222(-)